MAASATVELRLLERFVGRLTHTSQFFPELRPPLAVGYALCAPRMRSAGDPRGCHRTWAQLRRGGRREEELQTLFDVAVAMATDDVGVSMAPALAFTAREAPGVLTVVTDASRADADDGFGGFAFLPERDSCVFIMSEPWPPFLKAALDQATVRRTQRQREAHRHPAMSMPAAETFAAYALAAAVAGMHQVRAVVAVVDCAPAASAFSSLYSPVAQMRLLLGMGRRIVDRWLGVHVPREWNTDADRLSHPSLLPRVIADAERAGLVVVRVRPPEGVWAAARAALELPLGREVSTD